MVDEFPPHFTVTLQVHLVKGSSADSGMDHCPIPLNHIANNDDHSTSIDQVVATSNTKVYRDDSATQIRCGSQHIYGHPHPWSSCNSAETATVRSIPLFLCSLKLYNLHS